MDSVHQDLSCSHCELRGIRQEKLEVHPSYNSCWEGGLDWFLFFWLKFKALTVFTQAHYPQGESMERNGKE